MQSVVWRPFSPWFTRQIHSCRKKPWLEDTIHIGQRAACVSVDEIQFPEELNASSPIGPAGETPAVILETGKVIPCILAHFKWGRSWSDVQHWGMVWKIISHAKMGLPLKDKTEIQKQRYLLQVKYFCKILVCGIKREFSAFPKLKNPELFGKIDKNIHGKLFVLF